jgi:putative addiction module component (TIGR02574 family)
MQCWRKNYGYNRKELRDVERLIRENRRKAVLIWNAGCKKEQIGDNSMNPIVSSIFDLSPAEKLQLVEDLWDNLASTPEVIPVPDWQKEELARRKANLIKNPDSAVAWEEVKNRLKNRNEC